MPLPKRSNSFKNFKTSLKVAEALIKEARNHQEPIPPENRNFVNGLRGGAIVIMVAAFESYLTEAVAEQLDLFTYHPLRFNPQNLPEVMIFNNCKFTLERSLKGPYKIENPKRSDKIVGFREASDIVIKGLINKEVFCDMVRSNPNPMKVKDLFKSMGINDIFLTIKPEYDKRWGPEATTFVPDTLQNIIDRRHEVAHRAVTLNISQHDLDQYPKFLLHLAILCDETLSRHIKSIK